MCHCKLSLSDSLLNPRDSDSLARVIPSSLISILRINSVIEILFASHEAYRKVKFTHLKKGPNGEADLPCWRNSLSGIATNNDQLESDQLRT